MSLSIEICAKIKAIRFGRFKKVNWCKEKMDNGNTLEELLDDIKSENDINRKYIKFSQLITHPEITWDNLLDCLKYDGLIAEQTSVLLHSHLDIPKKTELITNRNVWERILDQKNISLNNKCGKLVKITKYSKHND